MGAVSLLTPCVFPMIPITVSYFTRANERQGGARRRALVYGAGIMATFTVFGMAIAVLAGAGGINRFAANPWVNLLVTAIFVAFAFNLFGAYQINVPSSVLTALDRATGQERQRNRRHSADGLHLHADVVHLHRTVRRHAAGHGGAGSLGMAAARAAGVLGRIRRSRSSCWRSCRASSRGCRVPASGCNGSRS